MEKGTIYNEKELLQKISEADEHAFKQLHNYYYDRVYYAALGFLKSHDLALDTLQDVFFNLWKKREILPAIENFRAFLMVMVRNELINALQRNTRRSQLNKSHSRQLPQDFMLSAELLEYKELESLIVRAIASLPLQQQTIYRLTREEGLSHADVAQRLGLSTKTVANNITIILNHLRVYLLNQGREYTGLLLFFL